jgi:methyl-accepting chemotaxis protein
MFLFGKTKLVRSRIDEAVRIIDRMLAGDEELRIEIPYDDITAPLIRALQRLHEQRIHEKKEAEKRNQSLLEALREMGRKHAEGWIDETLPAGQFGGVQAQIAAGINELVKSHIAVKMRVVDVIGKWSHGELAETMDRLPGKKGEITRAMDSVQESLKQNVAQRAENLRIRNALDNVTTNVMVADEGNNIVYMNSTARDMFKRAEAEIRRDLPHFNADHLVGMNIDAFHKDPAHQRRLLERLNGTYRSQLRIGNYHFEIIANPIISSEGKRVGTVVEWANRTGEILAQNEINTIVESIKQGNLGSRINLDGKQGFFKALGEGLNSVTESLERIFDDFGGVLEAIAEGDLTRATTFDGYTGVYASMRDDIMKTQSKLSEVFGQIRQAADFIYNSSQEIATGNNNLSQRAEEQASSLEETASSMEELTSTVKHNADNSILANQVSISTRQLAEKGGEVVNRAVAAMNEINSSSSKIANIISTIDEIAFQTNLLALNASVEAARAGEQGRGFAVVATEVRNLAQRSAKAAKESRELIQNSVEKVHGGSSLVTESGVMLNEIVSSVKKVGDLVSDIASASKEQADGIQQVNQAVAQMDEITQQNAALAEQASAASVSMCEQAKNMVKLLAFFRTHDSYAEPPAAHHYAKVRPKPSDTARLTSPKAMAKGARPRPAPVVDDNEWEEF